jgi:hypothetical protein
MLQFISRNLIYLFFFDRDLWDSLVMQYLRNFYRIHYVPESQSWLLFVFRITFKEYCYDDTYGRSAKDLTCPSDFGNIANLILKRYFSSDQELNNAIFSIVIKTVHYSWKMLCDLYCLSEIK